MLDTINGDVWHVQWSQESSKRGIMPIPDFVIAYPKNHLQIEGQCVDAVS